MARKGVQPMLCSEVLAPITLSLGLKTTKLETACCHVGHYHVSKVNMLSAVVFFLFFFLSYDMCNY